MLLKGVYKEIISNMDIEIKEIDQLYQELRNNIQFFNQRIKKYINFLRLKGLILKEGNKLYLL